jgi:hypothetical protein
MATIEFVEGSGRMSEIPLTPVLVALLLRDPSVAMIRSGTVFLIGIITTVESSLCWLPTSWSTKIREFKKSNDIRGLSLSPLLFMSKLAVRAVSRLTVVLRPFKGSFRELGKL